MAQYTVNEWVALFKRGDPLLLQAIVGNNYEEVATNLRTAGYSPGSKEDVINILSDAQMFEQETFVQILSVQNVPNSQPDWNEVLLRAANLWDGRGLLQEDMNWGNVFNLNHLYDNLKQNQLLKIMAQNNTQAAPPESTPTTPTSTTPKNYKMAAVLGWLTAVILGVVLIVKSSKSGK